MRVLRVTFLDWASHEAQVLAAALFLQELQQAGLRCSAEDGKTLDIVVDNPDEAVAVSSVLTKRMDLEWEVVGPKCPEHGSYTTSAWDRNYGEIWKCFTRACRHLSQCSDFLTMTKFRGLRSAALELPVGKEKPTEEVDPAHAEALLYVYRHLVHTPRNWRQFGDASKAAYALQNGIPVAFEATPEDVDKLEEVAYRAKGRTPYKGMKFIVQVAPQEHVLPPSVLEMAKSLRGMVKNVKLNVERPVNPMWGPSPVSEVRRLLGLKESLQKQIADLRAMLEEVTSSKNDIEKAGKRLAEEHESVAKASDKLLRVVAGMNLQDQPLSVQREVREAVHAIMKALKGEEPR
jgi:hypothetical protein